MKSLIALSLVVLVSLGFITSGSVNVPICHSTGSEQNPYNLTVVSVHSVDDARGLNGHGNHIDDAWKPFEFDGVIYPGQNEYLFGTVINDDCSLITGTPTPTLETPTETPTITPTECCCPTPTPTPEPNNILYFPIMQKAESVCYPYCGK